MLVRERQNQKHRVVRGGYTLMEMLVVVAIIVVLAGVGGYMLLPKVDEAKEDLTLTQAKQLSEAVGNYKLDNNDWPPNLQVLAQPKPGGGAPYIEESMLTPPIGGQWQYDAAGGRNKGLKPDIWADGRNGQPIGNWMPKVQH
jgi:general secretion pathway protein G